MSLKVEIVLAHMKQAHDFSDGAQAFAISRDSVYDYLSGLHDAMHQTVGATLGMLDGTTVPLLNGHADG